MPLVPLLVVRDAARALDFYGAALGAELVARFDNRATGTISHADLRIGAARIAITEEARAWNSDAPPSLGGSPVVLQLRVDDVRVAAERLCGLGAELLFPITEICGERLARLRDPFGHLWLLAQLVEELSLEEKQRRRDAFASRLAGARRRDPEATKSPLAWSIVADGLPLATARGSGQGAALVIVPSAFGVAPDLAAQMNEVATSASLVVSFDPFFRSDPGVAGYDDMARVIDRVRRVDAKRLAEDVREAIAVARAGAPGRRLVVLGICFGGPYAFDAASEGLADALATWHATGLEARLSRAITLAGPVRLHFGEVDPFVPLGTAAHARAAFASHADARVVVHAGATHGFTHRAAAAFDPEAERGAMRDVRELVEAP